MIKEKYIGKKVKVMTKDVFKDYLCVIMTDMNDAVVEVTDECQKSILIPWADIHSVTLV